MVQAGGHGSSSSYSLWLFLTSLTWHSGTDAHTHTHAHKSRNNSHHNKAPPHHRHFGRALETNNSDGGQRFAEKDGRSCRPISIILPACLTACLSARSRVSSLMPAKGWDKGSCCFRLSRVHNHRSIVGSTSYRAVNGTGSLGRLMTSVWDLGSVGELYVECGTRVHRRVKSHVFVVFPMHDNWEWG